MKKKIVALLLGMSMLVASLSACGNAETNNSQNSEKEIAESVTSEEKGDPGKIEAGELAVDSFAGTEITIAILKRNADLTKDFSEKATAKRLAEATGIKVNWITVDEASKDEKVATMLAGDLPDMFIGLLDNNTIMANPELFYDLSEEGLLETYAPDVYEDYNTSGAAWDSLIQTDGSIRGLLTNAEGNWNAQARGIWVINKQWLDQLGLDVPETTEELYEALVAFRDNDMNGNGDTTDEFPLSFCENASNTNICHMANFFGIAGEEETNLSLGKMVKDGEVTPTFDTKQYRDFLEYAHKLMDEGLLDVEGFSQSYEQYCAKLTSGQVGCFVCWSPADVMDAEMAGEYVLLSPVRAYEDIEFVQTGKKDSFAASVRAAIAADSENVEACLWYWNYASSSPESILKCWYGDERIDYNEDGLLYVLPIPDDIPDDMTSDNWSSSVGLFGGGMGPFLTIKDESANRYREYTSQNRAGMVKELYENDYISDEYMPQRNIAEEMWEVRDELDVELEAYIDSFMANCIMDGVSDDSWNTHVKQLETLGYGDWIEWYQGYLDGEF